MLAPRFDLVLLRNSPLTPDELSATLALVALWRKRRWAHAAELQIIALEGLGTHRVWAGFRYTEPDRELDELPRIAMMLDALLQAVPGARIRVRDDQAIFSHDHRRFTLKGTTGLPELDPGWSPPEEAWLEVDLPPMPEVSAGPPQRESELIDLLEIIERAGADSSLIRAGAGGAVRFGPQLQALTARRQFPVGACTLLANLAQRDLARIDDSAGTAQQIILDGDVRERQAARRLLSILSMTSAAPEFDPLTHTSAVSRIGARLLEATGFGEELDPETEEEWEDDLFVDDLELLSAPDADLPESPVAEALRTVLDPEELRRLKSLGQGENWAVTVLSMLEDSDESATGTSALLTQGIWPARRIPGLTDALHTLARSPDRPLSCRQLAVRALAATQRPDAGPLLIQLSNSPTLEIAREAILSLGQIIGASARRRVRDVLSDPRLAPWALASMSHAGDIAAFESAAELTRAPESSLQRAAARYLDQLGGRRALPFVEDLYRSSHDWEVRLEAAAALARLAPVSTLSEVLDVQDAEVLSWGLWSLGHSGRAGAAGWIRSAASDPRSEIREAAVIALGAQRLPAETPILLERLTDPDPVVCAAAAEALGRCADRRAVPVLREFARQPGAIGEQARRALRDGYQLRLPPPDSWLLIQAASPTPLSVESMERISAAMEGAGIPINIQSHRLEGRRQIDPADIGPLRSLVDALETLNTSVPGLRWSVRDPQAIIRRLGRRWILSSRNGAIAREGGWFSQAPPLPDLDRPQLAASPPPSQEFHRLPVAVTPRTTPDLHDVSMVGEQSMTILPKWEQQGEVDATESMELTIGRWLEEVAEDDSPPPIRARDALTPGKTGDVIRQISTQGLGENDQAELRVWLEGTDPHARIVACRLIEVAGDGTLMPRVLPLLDAAAPSERRHAARAIGAIGDQTALLALRPLLSDGDPDVQAAVREAIAAISGPAI